jgi:hypothetical protein
MKDYDPDRRQFLIVITSLPVVLVIGCGSEITQPVARAPLLSPEKSLKKLISLLGPWQNTDKEDAEDFARRFLKAKYLVSDYLPKSDKLIQNLASRFPTDTMAIKEVNLGNLPVKEQELLLRIVKQLYSFIEVRFFVSNETPWGVC